MAVDTWGAKNQPQFLDAGAPDIAVDPNAVADYAAKVGNRRVGTTAERTAAAGADLWEGLIWHDTTDGIEYKRLSGAWVPWVSDSGWINVAFAANWSSFSPGTYGEVAYRKRAKLVSLQGIAIAASGATTTILTLPVGFRPVVMKQIIVDRAGAYGFVNINTTGTVVASTGPAVGTTHAFGELSFSID